MFHQAFFAPEIRGISTRTILELRDFLIFSAIVVNEFVCTTIYLVVQEFSISSSIYFLPTIKIRVYCDSSVIPSFVNNCRAVISNSWIIRSSVPFTMELKHQDVLKRMRQNIVEDLDVNNGIIIPLTTEFILRDEDVTEIKKGNTKPRRAEILLDLLPL